MRFLLTLAALVLFAIVMSKVCTGFVDMDSSELHQGNYHTMAVEASK